MELFINCSIANINKTGGQEYNSSHHSGQGNSSNHLGCKFLANCNGSEFFRFVAIVKPSLLLGVWA